MTRATKKWWDSVLGIKQECGVPCQYLVHGFCTNPQFYENFKVSGRVISCSSRGDGLLLSVTKEMDGKRKVVKSRVWKKGDWTQVLNPYTEASKWVCERS